MDTYYYPAGEIDLTNSWVQRGTARYKLKSKAVAVLGFLLAHEGQLVSRAELFHVVWPGTVVGEEALRTCLRELRAALGDDTKHPRFIETVHGRGYRWLAPLSSTPPVMGRVELDVRGEDNGHGAGSPEEGTEKVRSQG